MKNKNIETLRGFLTRLAGKPADILQIALAGESLDHLHETLDALELELKPAAAGVTRYMLEDLRDEKAREKLAKERVLIYSREHQAYWRRSGQGYTDKRKDAGLFTFARAWELVHDLDKSKGIELEISGGAS